MKCVKVAARNAEKTKHVLLEAGALAKGFAAFNVKGFVYFPISSTSFTLPFDFRIVNKVFKKQETAPSLEELLKKALTRKESAAFVKSFDVVGDIAIIEVPDALIAKKTIIAKSLLASNKVLKTVLRKKSAMKGEYRIRDLEWLAGERKTNALYHESGAVMNVDLAKSYFSVRLAHERSRIADLIKPNEKILCLFAGVGPFPLVFFRKQKSVQIVAIELNPDAVKEMRENVGLNHAEKAIIVVEGDVNKIVPRDYRGWADRVVMPLPHTAFEFLDAAITGLKPGGVIHFYGFGANDKTECFADALEKIRAACKKNKKACKILNKRIVRPYSPSSVQVVIDFEIS